MQSNWYDACPISVRFNLIECELSFDKNDPQKFARYHRQISFLILNEFKQFHQVLFPPKIIKKPTVSGYLRLILFPGLLSFHASVHTRTGNLLHKYFFVLEIFFVFKPYVLYLKINEVTLNVTSKKKKTIQGRN